MICFNISRKKLFAFCGLSFHRFSCGDLHRPSTLRFSHSFPLLDFMKMHCTFQNILVLMPNMWTLHYAQVHLPPHIVHHHYTSPLFVRIPTIVMSVFISAKDSGPVTRRSRKRQGRRGGNGSSVVDCASPGTGSSKDEVSDFESHKEDMVGHEANVTLNGTSSTFKPIQLPQYILKYR